MRLAATLMSMALLVGCATTQSLPTEDRSQTFDAPYDHVFRAAVQELTDQGYAVSNADSDMGIINTEFQSNSGLSAAFVGERRNKITMMVAEQEGGTRIVATITAEQGNMLGGASSRSMTGEAARQMYTDLFEAIEDRL